MIETVAYYIEQLDNSEESDSEEQQNNNEIDYEKSNYVEQDNNYLHLIEGESDDEDTIDEDLQELANNLSQEEKYAYEVLDYYSFTHQVIHDVDEWENDDDLGFIIVKAIKGKDDIYDYANDEEDYPDQARDEEDSSDENSYTEEEEEDYEDSKDTRDEIYELYPNNYAEIQKHRLQMIQDKLDSEDYDFINPNDSFEVSIDREEEDNLLDSSIDNVDNLEDEVNPQESQENQYNQETLNDNLHILDQSSNNEINESEDTNINQEIINDVESNSNDQDLSENYINSNEEENFEKFAYEEPKNKSFQETNQNDQEILINQHSQQENEEESEFIPDGLNLKVVQQSQDEEIEEVNLSDSNSNTTEEFQTQEDLSNSDSAIEKIVLTNSYMIDEAYNFDYKEEEEEYEENQDESVGEELDSSSTPQQERSNSEDNKPNYETFYLPVIHEKFKTGFEVQKDFPIDINTVIAGRYLIMEYLGSAAFSRAVQCFDLHTKELVCIKIIKNNKDYFDQSLDEIKLLRYINSQGDPDVHHVVRLYEFFYHKEHLFLVCELLKDNLYEYSKHNRENEEELYFTIPRLQKITSQILKGLQFIHRLDLIHCDLKPENILIKSYSNCEVKIIDFGSSCFTYDSLCSYVQSRTYRAPEVILGLPYNESIDVWSLGCIVAELWTGNVLFSNTSIQTMLAKIIGICGDIPEQMLREGRFTRKFFTREGVLYQKEKKSGKINFLYPKRTNLRARLQSNDELFIDFVASCLIIDPMKRPTVDECLKHPFILSRKYKIE